MLFEFETTGLDIKTEPSMGGTQRNKLEQILMKLYYNRVDQCINVVHYLTPRCLKKMGLFSSSGENGYYWIGPEAQKQTPAL